MPPADHRSPPHDPRLVGLPASVALNVQSAVSALEHGDTSTAVGLLEGALVHAPTHAELLRLRGYAALMQNDLARALDIYRRAAGAWPHDGLIACQLGVAIARSGDLVEAEAMFRAATELDPKLADAWYNLGHALDTRMDVAGARDAFARVLEIEPQHQAARLKHAQMLKMLGQLVDAETDLRAMLERDRTSAPAWIALSQLGSFRPTQGDLEDLMRLHESGQVPDHLRISLAFASATLLEQAGHYEQAFVQFNEANAAKRQTVRWDAPAVSRLIDDILDQFSRSAPPRDDARGDEAIFFVGMPRSGSTLAEQILSAHPHVQGGGERNEIVEVLRSESQRRGRTFPQWVTDADDDDWARLGEEYLERCSVWRDGRARFSNKTLTNWQTLGAIRRMLPRAHIVHCRRDPLETLWSCYKHHFGEAQFFTYDREELIAFWYDCERAMRAWEQRYPGWIYRHDYEQLLDDPDEQIRRLQESCGLQPHPACLAFHENPRAVRTASASQVREPLRRPPSANERYGALLDSFRDGIARLNA